MEGLTTLPEPLSRAREGVCASAQDGRPICPPHFIPGIVGTTKVRCSCGLTLKGTKKRPLAAWPPSRDLWGVGPGAPAKGPSPHLPGHILQVQMSSGGLAAADGAVETEGPRLPSHPSSLSSLSKVCLAVTPR